MKRMFKTLTASLLLLAVILSAGCALTEDFTLGGYSSYETAFSSEDIFIVTLKESFKDFSGKFGGASTLEEYAQLLIDSNEITATVESKDGLVYYTYEIYDIDTQELSHQFFAFVYKMEDAFFLVQFAVKADAADEIFTASPGLIEEHYLACSIVHRSSGDEVLVGVRPPLR